MCMAAGEAWCGRQRPLTKFPREPLESDPTFDTGVITEAQHTLKSLAEESHLTAWGMDVKLFSPVELCLMNTEGLFLSK